MNDNKPVYTVNELCDRWRVARKTLLEAIRSGRLKAFKVGERVYRVSYDEVVRYERAA